MLRLPQLVFGRARFHLSDVGVLACILVASAMASCAQGGSNGPANIDAEPTEDAGVDAKGSDPTPDAAPLCGNGSVELGESCDDANRVDEPCPYNQEGCTVCGETCQMVAGLTSFCGDSEIDQSNNEACDDGNKVTEVCAYGMASCTVCSDKCQSIAGVVSQCGDKTVNMPAETCDDGNTVTEKCAYGVTSCTVCNGACKSVAGATSLCGDATLDMPNETCDDGNNVTEKCAYGLTMCPVCTATCQEGAGVTSYCNDGRIDATSGEECEDTNTTPGDGCSSACFTESFESEPNDDGATATGATAINGNDFGSANADGPYNVAADEFHIVAALAVAGDEDVFKLTSPNVSKTVTIETFGPTGYGACPSGTDTGITLRNAAAEKLIDDDDAGMGTCSKLTFTIPANGTVYVHVVEYGDNAAISRYYLVVTPQ